MVVVPLGSSGSFSVDKDGQISPILEMINFTPFHHLDQSMVSSFLKPILQIFSSTSPPMSSSDVPDFSYPIGTLNLSTFLISSSSSLILCPYQCTPLVFTNFSTVSSIPTCPSVTQCSSCPSVSCQTSPCCFISELLPHAPSNTMSYYIANFLKV